MQHLRLPLYSVVVDIELTDVQSGIQIRGRTKDLTQFGCGVDTLHLFPTGTSVTIKLSRGGATVTVLGRILYAKHELDIGVVFTKVEPEVQRILESWLVEPGGAPTENQ